MAYSAFIGIERTGVFSDGAAITGIHIYGDSDLGTCSHIAAIRSESGSSVILSMDFLILFFTNTNFL